MMNFQTQQPINQFYQPQQPYMQNPYMQRMENLQQFQQAIQPQTAQTKVVEVTGKAGAEAYTIGPDSSTLLLDNTAPIVWLVKTDGAGYKTLAAYDI
jgi:hypothetical protein